MNNRLHALGFVLTPYLHSEAHVRRALHERNARFHRRPLRKQPEHLPPRDDNRLDNFLDKREEFHCDGAMWSAYLHTSLKPDIPVAPLRADVGRSP
jgi:hypothetical protein